MSEVRAAVFRCFVVAATSSAIFIVGCASNQVVPDSVPASRDADRLLIVDCLLPGQLRRLGRSISYLTPRRPAKIPTSECEIRGGEYVAYDRANFSTSLKIWLPKAKSGDPEAQTYVGEIFEKGLGLPADPIVAASWYQKAADQGFSRAQVNLGYLYESGIGVPQDLVKAMNYYREAAGFDEGNLEYVTALQVANREQQKLDLVSQGQDIDRLNRQVAELESKNAALQAKQSTLRAERQRVTALANETELQRKRVLELKEDINSSPDSGEQSKGMVETLAQLDDLNQRLQTSESEKNQLLGSLSESQANTEQLQQSFNLKNRELNEARENLAAQERKLAVLESNAGSSSDDSAEILRLRTRLLDAQQAFDLEASKTTDLQRSIAQKTSLLQGQIASAETREQSMRKELKRLSGNVTDSQLTSAQLKSQLQDQINARKSEVEQLRRQLNNSVRELSVTQAGLQAAQSELDAQDSGLDNADNTLKKLNADLTQRIASANQLEQSLKSELQRLESTLANEQIEKAVLRNELNAQLEEQAQQTQQLRGRLQGSIDELEQAKLLILASSEKHASQSEQLKQLQQQIELQQSTMGVELEGTAVREKQLQAELEVARLRADDVEARADLLQKKADEQARLIASLNAEYEKSAQSLNEKDTELGAQQSQITQLQRELQRVRDSAVESEISNTVENAQLREELASEREVYAALQQEVDDLRNSQTDESRALEEQLAQANRAEEALKRNLNSRTADAEYLEQQLLSLQGKYQQDLKEAESELVASKGELRRAQDERVDAQLKLASLESSLVEKRNTITDQEGEINRLQSEVTKAQARADKPQIERVPQVVNAGPTIEIIEPEITVTRGGPAIKVGVDEAAKSFDVIGKISPSEDVISFKIDNGGVELNDNGVFKHTTDGSGSTLRMVAINDKGKRTDLELLLSRTSAVSRSSVQEDADLSGIKFGKYHALIIGNNKFENLQNLKTAENDAITVEELLREKYGFETKLLLNATRYDILSAMNDLREKLTTDDNLLIYYAGHGELANETGYWLPVDAEPDSDANWISNSSITKYVETINAKHVIVVADSCYSGTLSRTSMATLDKGRTAKQKRKWYEFIAKAKVRTVFTSGGVKPVLDSFSGSSRHSIFSAAFIDELSASQEPVLSTYKLFLKVQERVKAEATRLGLDQNPQYSPMQYAGHESGQFLFVTEDGYLTGELDNPLGGRDEAPTMVAFR